MGFDTPDEALHQLKRAVDELLSMLGSGAPTIADAPAPGPRTDPTHDSSPGIAPSSTGLPDRTPLEADEATRRLMNELEIFGLKFPDQHWLSPQWRAFLTQNVGDLIAGRKKKESGPSDIG